MSPRLKENPKHQKLSLALDPSLRRGLIAEATRQERSVGGLIRVVLKEYLAKQEG